MLKVKKDAARLSHRNMKNNNHIEQYNRRVLYKPVLQLFKVDWLSWNKHEIGKDEVMPKWTLS